MQRPDRLADLKRAMALRDVAGNALLNVAAEAVAHDVGCIEAGRIFSRLGDFLGQGHQPPSTGALPLSGFDA
ncbi:MAG: hypothetical protein KIS73_02000 [Enhydrobacter sp.]|nr:hypothetical protein [Enhydrobacter sp.]